MLRIGWSFYAGAVGSWAIVTPSQVSMGSASSAAVIAGVSLVHWQNTSAAAAAAAAPWQARTCSFTGKDEMPQAILMELAVVAATAIVSTML
jgi:hypothetical protein